jgi:hypothetical protein
MNIDNFIIKETNTLVWTLTSNGYKFITHNLITNLRNLKVPWKLCVICSDTPSYLYMKREGIPCIKSPKQVKDFGSDIVRFESKNFQKLNILKLNLLEELSKDERIDSCIYMDGDIAVYNNFVPDILDRLSLSSLLFQCDEHKKDLLCESSTCPWVCTGFIAWKKGIDSSIFKINEVEVWNNKPEDQAWVNYALKKYDVKYLTLPRNLYPNGMFVNIVGPKNTKEEFILHYNYRIGQQKREDMKRFGDWYLVV